MERSWLVQRLNRPFRGNPDSPLAQLGTSLSFGGGLRNGGLTKDAMALLRQHFEFDYMGAAEFEFGAVPEAFRKMTKADLEAFTVEWPLSEVKASWRLQNHSKRRLRKGEKRFTGQKVVKPKSKAQVFVIAPKGWRDEIATRIKDWAGGKCDLKESTRLNTSLLPTEEWETRVQGWVELDNGFMFFTDRDMFNGVASLFGVETGKEGSIVKPA